MKRILAISLVLVMAAAVFLTGCSSSDERESELKTTFKDTNAQLCETFSDSGSKFTMIEEYLTSWAKTNKLTVSKTSQHYMVISNGATKGHTKDDQLALLCPIDPNNMADANRLLAVGLTSVLGPEDHGRLELIVTETTNEGFLGSIEINKKYLNVDNIINLTNETKSGLKTSGVYEFDTVMSKKLDRKDPSYEHAYTITMTVSPYNDAYDFGNKYPNPISVIGNYLASNQSSGKLFELASFDSKSTLSHTAYSATAVVVIDDNNVESMKSKFEKSYESIKDKCDKLDVDFVYTMTETEKPDKVLSSKNKSSIIGLIYTIDAGIYSQDEESGDILSADDIVSVRTSSGKLKLKLNARAVTQASLDELDQTLAITAGLSDVKYSKSDSYITWHSGDDISSFFKTALSITDEDYVFTTIKTSDLNVITSKNNDVNCIKLGITDDTAEASMLNCIHYMTHLAGGDEEEN